MEGTNKHYQGERYPRAVEVEPPDFPTTSWTVLREAAGNGTVARGALEQVCRQYWYPLYAFARREGHNIHDAQDLTQGFFETLLTGGGLAQADPQRGRLRSFLLGALKRFMARDWRTHSASKRGGGKRPLSINTGGLEERLGRSLASDGELPPDRFFDRCWALDLLDRARHRLEDECRRMGTSQKFRILAPHLAWNAEGMTYRHAARALGISEGAVKVAVHRMRKQFGQLLRDEIADTVSTPDQIEEELQALVAILREP